MARICRSGKRPLPATVTLAHSKGISVEAELGTIAGSEDGIVNSEVIYADPRGATPR